MTWRATRVSLYDGEELIGFVEFDDGWHFPCLCWRGAEVWDQGYADRAEAKRELRRMYQRRRKEFAR
jgi:hypothetical protein